MDIVFIFPPLPSNFLFTYHLGAGYIRSYVQQHNIETAQFITRKRMTVPGIAKRILEYDPEIVGFTCYDSNYASVRIIARLLRKMNPHLTIVLGGPTATFSDKEVMEHTPEIDVCVRGEGEKTVLELLQTDDLESVCGITFRSGDTLISTPNNPLISGGVKKAELDVLPSPYLTGLIPPDGATGILTARGCVHHCIYCNFSIMFNHTIRYHSVNRVMQELELLHDHWNPSQKMITIYDDTFTLDLKRAKNICQRIIDEGVNLPLSVEARADSCDKELLELMRDSGVKRINFGLESASCNVLKTIKKAPGREKQFLSQVKTCVQWARKAGLTVSVSIICGLPGEGIQEALETLTFVKNLDVDEYSHNTLAMFAGTELFSRRKEYNLDVCHSSSFLPYLTQYTYDVGKVTPLPHSSFNEELKKWKKTYFSVFSYKSRNRNKKLYKYLVLRKMPDNDEFCNWLQKKCALYLSVFDVTGDTKEEAIRRRKLFLEAGVPVGDYSLIEKNTKTLHLLTQIDPHTSVEDIPFHKYERGEALTTVNTKKDAEALVKFFNTHVKEGVLRIHSQEIPKTLQSACRWGECICPAPSGVLVIDGNDVLFCHEGECIGKVGDSRRVLQNNMQEILHEKERERGCSQCSVRNKCSRCPFPPFPEFCEVKRRYPGISVVVTVLEWLHSYPDGEQGVVALRVDETAPPLFYHGPVQKSDHPEVRDTIRLISRDGNACAFSAETMKNLPLHHEQAVILESFQLGIDKETLISYLCEITGEKREKCVRIYFDAVAAFDASKFLEKTNSKSSSD